MRGLAILGPRFPEDDLPNPVDTVDIGGVPVRCTLIETREPSFDPSSEKHRNHVLVRTKAFSCNYRDRARILRVALAGTTLHVEAARTDAPPIFNVIGSEFVGVVEAVGADVADFKPGDRVTGDGAYPMIPARADVRSGLPTNHASRELAVYHEAKLIKVPSRIPDDVAGGLSLGGQTSYSIVRRLNLKENEKILVTSARSNTSLFVIRALKNYPVDVYATTTSERNHRDLEELGVKRVFVVGRRADSLATCKELRKFHAETGGFNVVVDPMNDAHLAQVVFGLTDFGRYISCGIVNQTPGLLKNPVQEPLASLSDIMAHVLFHNVSIIGNCLGLRSDLERALEDCANGRFDVTIDSVFSGTEAGGFLRRTYSDEMRFGKVIFRYE